MTKGTRLIELRPNRLLLDPAFGGYKLSLDSIPIYTKNIESGIKVIRPGDDQYSFCHVKLFSLHNHLHPNPHNPDSVYFIDKNSKVFKLGYSPPNLIFTREVFEIPNAPKQQTQSYNPSITFGSSDVGLVSDGNGGFHLVKIDGKGEETWKLQLSFTDVACVLADARIESVNQKRTLDVLIQNVEEKGEEGKGSLFQTKVKWRMFVEGSDGWRERGTKELCVAGSVDYLALEPGCKSLYIISDKPPKWSYDSENEIKKEKMEVDVRIKPKYTWTQTEEEITIWLPLEGEITKSDLMIAVDELKLEVKIKEAVVISGEFFNRVSKDLTTWSYDKDRIEIQLTKYESGLMWKTLMPGNEEGEEIVDAEMVKNIHQKLSHLCSVKEETGSGPSFNTENLEECDVVSCDTSSLFRVNGETHITSHEVSLSSLQWLFKIPREPGQSPAICIRHDVDACVWQLRAVTDEKTWPQEHVGTFSAFGYVQASKTQKKFLTSPPDLSYVAICEGSHHIYIYRQPTPLTSELKNRHTGKKVDTISRQQLVNLEAKEQIMGVHATNSFLFVLLENTVCALAVNV